VVFVFFLFVVVLDDDAVVLCIVVGFVIVLGVFVLLVVSSSSRSSSSSSSSGSSSSSSSSSAAEDLREKDQSFIDGTERGEHGWVSKTNRLMGKLDAAGADGGCELLRAYETTPSPGGGVFWAEVGLIVWVCGFG